MGETPSRRNVDLEEIRRRFNLGRYAEQAEAGEFAQLIVRDAHPSLEGSTEPFCTRSQIVAYRNRHGDRIAVVHRYLRRDGTVGGSGRPDPKLLLDTDGLVYVLRPTAPQTEGREESSE